MKKNNIYFELIECPICEYVLQISNIENHFKSINCKKIADIKNKILSR